MVTIWSSADRELLYACRRSWNKSPTPSTPQTHSDNITQPRCECRQHTHTSNVVEGLVMHKSRLCHEGPGRSHPPVPSSRTSFLSAHRAAFRGRGYRAAKKRWTWPSSRLLMRPTVQSNKHSSSTADNVQLIPGLPRHYCEENFPNYMTEFSRLQVCKAVALVRGTRDLGWQHV